MKNYPAEIDLVYLWVDGNDPVWRAKREALTGKTDEGSAANCKGRYVDNDELKYSLRSVEKYAPWIRRIFIVTDNQIPAWLDTANPKVQIVDHRDILPPESLPCFNSSVIEKFLYKIPGLSEQFLYANDDTFINRTVSAADFFTADGLPIIRLTRKRFRKLRWWWRERIRKKPLQNYSRTICNASDLVMRKYGVYCTGLPHHNIDAYLKSDCRRVAEQIFRDEFKATEKNYLRSDDDLQRVVYSYVALIEKRAHLRHPSKRESLHVLIHKERHYRKFERYAPMLFCMNDSQYAADSDRERTKVFLERLFPEKSGFEK